MNLNFSANMAGFCRDSHKCTWVYNYTILYAQGYYLLLYKAEKPSVRIFLAVNISAVATWIDVRFARRHSYVISPGEDTR